MRVLRGFCQLHRLRALTFPQMMALPVEQLNEYRQLALATSRTLERHVPVSQQRWLA
jgi:hypothetical protein